MATFFIYWFVDSDTEQPFYIGKSHERIGYDRIYEHEYMARRLTHYNKPLQTRIRRGNYTVIKKVTGLDEEDAFTLEAAHIQRYGLKCRGGTLLNLVDGTARGGYTWTADRRGDKRSTELAKRKGRPVSQYTLTCEFVAEHSSAKVASRAVPGANASYIGQVCRGTRKQAGGYVWKYANDAAPTRAYQTARGRRIEQLTLTGDHVALHTSGRALRLAGFKFRYILDCCRGKTKSSQGFIWRYDD